MSCLVRAIFAHEGNACFYVCACKCIPLIARAQRFSNRSSREIKRAGFMEMLIKEALMLYNSIALLYIYSTRETLFEIT